MKKNSNILVITLLLLAFSFVSNAQPPSFTGGHTQALAVCKNSGTNAIDTLMQVSDTSIGHIVSWSVFAAPAHGTLAASAAATSTGGVLIPSGLSYMPAAGYVGNDVFTIEFMDGTSIDTTHVAVTMDTPLNPGVITGPDGLCTGAAVLYSDATTGGTWIVTNAAASIDGAGTVTGLTPGTDSILYILSNGCISAAIKIVTVNAAPYAGTLPIADSICVGGHVTLVTGGDAGGIWHSTNTVIATVNSGGVVTGLATGMSRIAYLVTNSCGTDTAIEQIKVQNRVMPIIGDNTVCQFQMLTLLDLSPGGTWSSSSFFVAPIVGGIVFGLMPGTSTISYTFDNTCGTTTATLNVTVITGGDCASAITTAPVVKDELSVYPNPNNGFFNLNLSSGIDEQAEVVITNVVGEKVRELSSATNQVIEVRLNNPGGLYIIKATTLSGKSYMTKAMVNQ